MSNLSGVAEPPTKQPSSRRSVRFVVDENDDVVVSQVFLYPRLPPELLPDLFWSNVPADNRKAIVGKGPGQQPERSNSRRPSVEMTERHRRRPPVLNRSSARGNRPKYLHH
jgi:hypothetical protein